jgi:thiol-disulfide isomerase/thioredoxin
MAALFKTFYLVTIHIDCTWNLIDHSMKNVIKRAHKQVLQRCTNMSKEKELEIHTVIVDGDSSSFRAALSRSILGVTWVKFKRKKQAFYKNRAHNLAITQSVFNWLYESLLTNIRNLGTYKLKTDLKPLWDANGKISAISDITVSVYMKVGELRVKELQVHEKFRNVKMDLFYSQTEFSSQELRSKIPLLIESMGKEIIYHDYDYSTKEGKEMADAYGVRGTPTIVINADKKSENPDVKELQQEIEDAFAPVVESVEESKFIRDPALGANIESLTQLLQKISPSKNAR